MPRNIENRWHPSDYSERMRIKGEHLRERIRTTGWRARKSRSRVSTKTLFLLNFFARERGPANKNAAAGDHGYREAAAHRRLSAFAKLRRDG